jgi:hypothetical protein
LDLASISFAGGEREEILRAKPNPTRRVAALPEDQSFWDRGVASNQKVTGRYRAPSRLFSAVPRRGFEIAVLADGEDYGYFASAAGDAGSNPATGLRTVWSKRKDT